MQEEKKKILQMVQEGLITVDEAYTILNELDKANKESEKKEENLLNELSTVVLNKETPKENESLNKKVQFSKEKILGFVETAIQKIKDTDLDFNFGASQEINHIFQDLPRDLKEIEIEIANGKLSIETWDQPDIRIECAAKVYRSETQAQAREEFLKNVHFTNEEGRVRFHVLQKSVKVDTKIFVPVRHYESISIRLFNGGITGGSLLVDTLKAKTANGAITLQKVEGKTCDAETGNGKITINDTRFEVVEAESLNGAIVVNGHYQQIDAQSFNGQISCQVLDPACESIQAKSVTGSIQLQLPSGASADGELKSNLGSFNISLGGIDVIEEKSDVIQKVLKFKTQKDTLPSLHLFADTKTGAITIS